MKNKILMPTEVSEEVLNKQFMQVVEQECVICAGTGIDPFDDKCDLCNGLGKSMLTVEISDEVIKEIYATSVELMGQDTVSPDNKPQDCVPTKNTGRGRPKKGK